MKLSKTTAQNSFKYSWLLSRIFPYIKPYLFRIFLGFAIAIPLGLLDGVTAFSLKPYMDYVIGGKEFVVNWHGINFIITSIQMSYILPIAVINEGELVELGTHDELMNIENGQYKALYEMQFKKQEVI